MSSHPAVRTRIVSMGRASSRRGSAARYRRRSLRLYPGGRHAGRADAALPCPAAAGAGGRHGAGAHDGEPDAVDARRCPGLHHRPRPRHAAHRARRGRATGRGARPRPSGAGSPTHFGTAHKAFFITADTMTYDFGRLAPLDFAFIDGGHDLEHVLNDSRKAYDALAPGGWLVWHDFNSPVPWVKVREAIERLGFAEPVVHVEGTEVAFLRKQAPVPSLGRIPGSTSARVQRGSLREARTPDDDSSLAWRLPVLEDRETLCP